MFHQHGRVPTGVWTAFIVLAVGLNSLALSLSGAWASSPEPFAVKLQFSPVPSIAAPSTIAVTVTDTVGKPVSGATVTAGFSMLTMDMGKDEVALKQAKPGKYVGTCSFAMSGSWKIVVTAVKGSLKTVVTKAVTVKSS
jgi:hypothetical protein